MKVKIDDVNIVMPPSGKTPSGKSKNSGSVPNVEVFGEPPPAPKKTPKKGADGSEEEDSKTGAGGSGKEKKDRPKGFDDHTGEKQPKGDNSWGDQPEPGKLGQTPGEIIERINDILDKAQRSDDGFSASKYDVILKQRPLVNWKSVLRRFFTESKKTQLNYQRPNMKMLSGRLYEPSRKVKSLALDVCVVVDTSGSITEAVLNAFLTEISGIINASREARMRLMLFADRLYFDEVFVKDKHGIKNIKNANKLYKGFTSFAKDIPWGTGGTQIMPVINKLNSSTERENIVMIFTDGLVETLSPDVKINMKKNPKTGLFVMLQQPGASIEEMEKLGGRVFDVQVK